MLIGSRDARPAAPQASQADTASSAASAGPSLEAFPLTRREPTAGLGGSPPLPSLSFPSPPSPPPLLLYCVDDGEGGSFGLWNG